MKGHKERIPDYVLELCREFRTNPTETEQLLWKCLRNGQIQGLRFRRQHPIGRYIADFYCHSVKLIIEIDGGIHLEADRSKYDSVRQEALESGGFRVIRFTDAEIRSNPAAVLREIARQCQPSPPTPLPRGEGRR